MEMEERDLKEIIDEQMKDLEIPDSLRPENITRMLEEKQSNKRRKHGSILAAAVCCMAVVGISSAGILGMQTILGQHDGILGQKEEGIRTAKSYDEVYRCVQAAGNYYVSLAEENTSGLEAEDKSGQFDSDIMNASPGAALEFSETNVREEGVGEADVVKTDGRYIYTMRDQTIYIVDALQDTMELVSTIQLEREHSYGIEFFVKDHMLVAAYSDIIYGEDQSRTNPFYSEGEYTFAEVYDISDAAAPKFISRITQSGSYDSMRAAGDYVYLMSFFYAPTYCSKFREEEYIPSVDGKCIESGDIFMPAMEEGNVFAVVSSFSIRNPEEKIDTKAILGLPEMFYVNKDNIYAMEYCPGTEEDSVSGTCIRKISYQDGVLNAVGQAEVKGSLKDSFCIDEFNGKLRLVTTSQSFDGDTASDSNNLYILDEDLQELSRIEDIAPGEKIFSARFMGDTGYFVTYRQTDPLFSVDLTDPENPRIIGSLKIPGFSKYLHPYGEGLLLGIGMDMDDTGTVNNGVKLSMFDISDPSAVQEADKYVIEEAYETPVSYNYKAACVYADKNLIGLVASFIDAERYYIFSYGEDGFTCLLNRELPAYSYNARMLYIGDRIYIAGEYMIESFRMDTFEKINDIVL